jgi:hypothetical protein
MLTIKINGVNQSWTIPASQFVSYYLASPYDTIEFSVKPTAANFVWIGK